MSLDDFCRLDFAEFEAVHKEYAGQRDAMYKDGWERARAVGYMAVMPHLGKHRKTMHQLFPFPWDDGKKKADGDRPRMSREEQRERMKRLAEKLGDKMWQDNG